MSTTNPAAGPTAATASSPTADLGAVRELMARQAIDAWVVYDLRGSSQVLPRLLGGKQHLTRRVFWILHRSAREPRVLCHNIDTEAFKKLAIPFTTYAGWADLPAALAAALKGSPGGEPGGEAGGEAGAELGGKPAGAHTGTKRIAMEYSPGGALPVASTVDAGTIELVRALGLEVVSSADIVQRWAARWSEAGLDAHRRASAVTALIMPEAFAFIAAQVRAHGVCQERAAQAFITGRFKAEGLAWPDDPIVSVNDNSGSPHYGPDQHRSSPIRPGDWVLIDLWCRYETLDGVSLGDAAIFSDITWTGFVGASVPSEHRRVFDAVRNARDATLNAAKTAWAQQRPIEGWQLDDAARGVLHAAGLDAFIKHRTGHSLSPGALVHGIGMNLDNLESHDTRTMLAGTGFTIEPGAYTPGFGVRNEINIYVDPTHGPVVTSCVQDQPTLVI